MKRFFPVICLIGFLFSCNSIKSGNVSGPLMLDTAIGEAAADIETRLSPGTKIALLNFSSPSEGFSEYVLEELSGLLVNGGKLVVVDRRDLDLIQQEEQYQLSGEVSDESAQAIGRKLGAQVIASGSITGVGETYRFRVKTLAVETAAIISSFSVDIDPTEPKTVSLLGGATVTETVSVPNTAYSNYIINLTGTDQGVITVLKETSGRIIITIKINADSVFLTNDICPLIPPGYYYYINSNTSTIIFEGNTETTTWVNGSWSKTVGEGNTWTTTNSDGYWEKTVVERNTETTSYPNGSWYIKVTEGNTVTATYSSGYSYKTVTEGNTVTTTNSDGTWKKTVTEGNAVTTTSSDGSWEKTVTEGDTETITKSNGYRRKQTIFRQGNIITVHIEEIEARR